MTKINLNRKIKSIKQKVLTKIDKKIDPQRKDRELFLKRYNVLTRKTGSSKRYLNDRLQQLKSRFSLFNDFFTANGSPLSFKMVEINYKATPNEIINRKWGARRGDNNNVFEHEIMQIIKNDKNNRSKIQQLKGLKYEIEKFEEKRKFFLSELNNESLILTDNIISLEKEYSLAKDKIKFDQNTKTQIESEINSWKSILRNIRSYVREINAQQIDVYYKTIENNIARLGKAK